MRRRLLTAQSNNDIVEANGHEFVDLGLSVLWATCNVDANSPGGSGDYFAWGASVSRTTKGYYTGKTDLPIEYDTANIIMGGDWRMPTRDEFQELNNNCSSSWATLNGVNGFQMISKENGKSIFSPLLDGIMVVM